MTIGDLIRRLMKMFEVNSGALGYEEITTTLEATTKQKEIILEAINKYGEDLQKTVAIEEMSELIKAICKNRRGAQNKPAITDEIADVYIMLEQLKMIYQITDESVKRRIEHKIKRLERRMLKC